MLDQIVLADRVGWGHMAGWGWAVMILGWLLMFTLVVIVAWALRGNGRPGSRAIELLDERFARGDIDSDDYVERRKELGR